MVLTRHRLGRWDLGEDLEVGRFSWILCAALKPLLSVLTRRRLREISDRREDHGTKQREADSQQRCYTASREGG